MGRTYKRQNRPSRNNQHLPAIYWLIHATFSGKGYAEHKSEVHNGFIMASIFLHVIDWLAPFSQGGGLSGCGTLWCAQNVLVMLTKQDVQTFSACNWFTRVVFTGRGFSGCGTLWWSWKCCHCLICSPNRKCQCFPACNSFTHALYLIMANIRSVLTYAFPSRASLRSGINMMKLIQIEKSSIKIIDPDLSYR